MMRYLRFVYNNFLRCALRLNSHSFGLVGMILDIREEAGRNVSDLRTFLEWETMGRHDEVS